MTYAWTGAFGTASGVNSTVLLLAESSAITLVVNDGQVASQPDTVNITVEDSTPPEISVTCSPGVLWPPNHKMVEIVPTVTSNDICDASPIIGLYQITINEGEKINTYDPNYDDTLGDGNTTDDIRIDPGNRIYLRAERGGTNPEGRKYTITYKATDASGNAAMTSCEVLVPHDQR